MGIPLVVFRSSDRTGFRITFIVFLLAALASPGPVVGQEASGLASLPLDDMQFRLIGPFRGGRSVAVAGHPTERLTFYFGSTGGGVWKTLDAGHSWTNVSDGFFKTGSVGAIAVAPSQPETVYVGMGEHAIRGNTSHGDGVYRSDDGGETWRTATRQISNVIVHPTDPDLVYVAALGHAWGPNEERGIYRSRDGGETWDKARWTPRIQTYFTPGCGRRAGMPGDSVQPAPAPGFTSRPMAETPGKS
jgi:photosystem II stability/assembly factor-like uncharacterized protein